MENFDFEGYATRTNIKCADGRVIMPNAFADCDGITVPIVWNHDHASPEAVLGHALLMNRSDGVWTRGTFNNTPSGQVAKELVGNGDIVALSIYANKLKQNGPNVVHGMIREVSLVLAGANPGAYIENVITHSEDGDDEAMIFTFDGEKDNLSIAHAEEKEPSDTKKEEAKPMAEEKKSSERTVQDVWDEMTSEQKAVCAFIAETMLKDSTKTDDSKEESTVKHNVFEGDETNQGEYLTHSDMEEVIKDAKRLGSMRDAVIQHGIEDVAVLQHAATQTYGVTPIANLYPDAHLVRNTPDFIKRDQEWVSKLLSKVHHAPWSRIKSIHANITADEARARGYTKGNKKVEEVFTLLKRSTTPTTIYKKQKIDRDDVIDITDFDVVAWIKGEMSVMYNEEKARAFLIGDGRLSSSADKIDEQCIRPILTDDDLYTVKVQVTQKTDTSDQVKELIKAVVRARKDYKGSGNLDFYTTEEILTEMLLLEDGFGRRLYEDESKVAAAMRVRSIVTVPVMENVTGPKGGALLGIAVNMADYTVGADKGGATNLFDDFDINYNQMLYLMEGRCSGALTIPYSAMEFEIATSTSSGG